MFGTDGDEAFFNDVTARGAARPRRAWRAVLLVASGLGAFLAWAASAEIEEVTRGTGRVIPSSQVQSVQSLEGGIVAAIAVREGDIVEQGDVLVQIDDTGFASQRGELLQREASLLAETARVEAEARQADAIVFPEGLEARAPLATAAEAEIFVSRRAQLQSEIAVLTDQLRQRESALAEQRATLDKTREVLVPLTEEIAQTERFVGRGSVSNLELLRLIGRRAELQGDLAIGRARLPGLEAAIGEARNQIEAARSAYLLTARERLSRLQVDLAVVQEELRAANDRVTRTALRAPVRGTINTLVTRTIGAVVQPGAPVVEIVPIDDRLLIEARIRPRDVAFIGPGDPASVKITAYDYLVYGTLSGEVRRIGADATETESGETFFRVIVETAGGFDTGQGDPLTIIPGMVAQVDVQTGRKTVLDYLIQPLRRVGSEALRER